MPLGWVLRALSEEVHYPDPLSLLFGFPSFFAFAIFLAFWVCGGVFSVLFPEVLQGAAPRGQQLHFIWERKKPINIKNIGGTRPGVRPVCPGNVSRLSRGHSVPLVLIYT